MVTKNQVQDVLKSMKSFSTLPPNINTRYLVDSEFAMLEKVLQHVDRSIKYVLALYVFNNRIHKNHSKDTLQHYQHKKKILLELSGLGLAQIKLKTGKFKE